MAVSSMLAAVLSGKAQKAHNTELQEEHVQTRNAPDDNVSGARLPERDTAISLQSAAELKARRGESVLATTGEHDTVIECTAKGWKCIKHQVSGKIEQHAWRIHERLVPNEILPIFDSAHTARAFIVPFCKTEDELYNNLASNEWHSALTAAVKRSREYVSNRAESPDEKVALLASAIRAMALQPCTFYPLSAFAEYEGANELGLGEQEWLCLLCGFGRLWPGSGLLSQEDAEGNIYFGLAPDSDVAVISSSELSQLFSACPFRGVGAGSSWAFLLPKADRRVCVCGEMLEFVSIPGATQSVVCGLQPKASFRKFQRTVSWTFFANT